MKEIVKETGIVMSVCFIFTLFIFLFTPYPATGFIHHLFASGGPAKEPNNYQEVKEQVVTHLELTYPSLINQNTYDLVLPKTGENFPVIFWVHGGAYVGGQKEDVSIYANMLAAEGYAVVNMEYALAPETRYPGPLIQLNDVYREVLSQATDYSLNMDQVIFAGDSAGGQIVSQYVNIQVNQAYSDQLNFLAEVPQASIKGALLFCSPYSLTQLATPSDLPVVNYFVKNVGWAYTGNANWLDSPVVSEADLMTVVTANFPPIFITDGNDRSFEEQGKAFAKLLEGQGTTVTTAFYPIDEAKLEHEYQFDLTLPQAAATFQKVIAFLNDLDY